MTLPIEKAQIAKTTEQWTSLNPVLDLDVIGIEVMTNGYNRYKRGDGSTTWNSLAYLDKVYSDQAVASVNNQTGAVTISKSDVGLANVDNTADANKSVANADTVDNKHASDFLGATATATNADKLDGYHANAFLGASATAADSDKLDGYHASSFARSGFGLGDTTSPTLSNANTIRGNGFYLIPASATGGVGSAAVLLNHNFDANFGVQFAVITTGSILERVRVSGTWGSWKVIISY